MPITDGLGWRPPKIASQGRTDGPSFSVGDPALADYLGLNLGSAAGVPVNERTSLGLTAVYRAVSIIAGTIAALPMNSYRKAPDGTRQQVTSIFDDPGSIYGLSPFQWKELVMAHLLLHGNFFGLHTYNGAGALAGLLPLHPSSVTVKYSALAPGGKVFSVPTANGNRREVTSIDLTHIMALGTDGITGMSPIQLARNSLGTNIAGDNAAARMFSNGLLLGGVVSVDEDLTPEQGEQLKQRLEAKLSGSNNAGTMAVVPAKLKFTPWTMPARDAQFVEARGFQIEEISRIYGIPKVLLAQDGASTWGSGIAEMVRGMARFTFMPWTSRIEEQLSMLLQGRPGAAPSRYVEFDYAGLLQPSTTEMTANIIAEVEAGILTVNEARKIQNRPPVEGGDIPRLPAGPTPLPKDAAGT